MLGNETEVWIDNRHYRDHVVTAQVPLGDHVVRIQGEHPVQRVVRVTAPQVYVLTLDDSGGLRLQVVRQ